MLSLGEAEADVLLRNAEHAYRRLARALSWPLVWRKTLRDRTDTLLSVTRIDPAVEKLLSRAHRRIATSLEPVATSPVAFLQARATSMRRQSLEHIVHRRLPRASETELNLVTALHALESEAWRETSTRRLEESSWALAEDLLPAHLPEVLEAQRGLLHLESRVLRPSTRAGALPWSVLEVRQLSQVLPATESALAILWRRVATLEPTGQLEALLRRRAKSPRKRIQGWVSGAQVLINATFWCDTARSRLAQSLREGLPGIELKPAELFPVVEWWVARGTAEPTVALQAAGGLSEWRAALLEFRATWQDVEKHDGGSTAQSADWWRLQAQADRLDRLGPPSEDETGLEPLRRFVHFWGRGRVNLPRGSSVVGWVRAAWALSASDFREAVR